MSSRRRTSSLSEKKIPVLLSIRVNAIAPGPIRTEIWNVTNLSDEAAKEHEKRITGNNLMQRFGEPEEVASAALFLASNESSFISGAVIAVDGADGAF